MYKREIRVVRLKDLEEGRRVSLPMSLPEKPFLEEGERDLRKFDRWKWVLVSEW